MTDMCTSPGGVDAIVATADSMVGRLSSASLPLNMCGVMCWFTPPSGNEKSTMTLCPSPPDFSRDIIRLEMNHRVKGGVTYGPERAPSVSSLFMYTSTSSGS